MDRVNQFKQVYESFYATPSTMMEVAKRVGIDRANICWYCRDFRNNGYFFVIRQRICSITNHRAQELTTNPNLVPPNAQLKLLLVDD
jgi:hypothetical protein